MREGTFIIGDPTLCSDRGVLIDDWNVGASRGIDGACGCPNDIDTTGCFGAFFGFLPPRFLTAFLRHGPAQHLQLILIVV